MSAESKKRFLKLESFCCPYISCMWLLRLNVDIKHDPFIGFRDTDISAYVWQTFYREPSQRLPVVVLYIYQQHITCACKKQLYQVQYWRRILKHVSDMNLKLKYMTLTHHIFLHLHSIFVCKFNLHISKQEPHLDTQNYAQVAWLWKYSSEELKPHFPYLIVNRYPKWT